MWTVIGALLQLILLFTKNKFEKDAEERKRKDGLYVEAKAAVKIRDVSSINSILGRVRQQ